MEKILDFEPMLDGHPGLVMFLKHQIKLSPGNAKSAHSVSSQAGAKARKFEKDEIHKKFSQTVSGTAQTKRRAEIVFLPTKHGYFLFFVDNRELNAVTKRYGYPEQRMDAFIDVLGEAALFPRLDANSGFLASRDRKRKIVQYRPYLTPRTLFLFAYAFWITE